MQIEPDEIRPGLVAWLSQEALTKDPQVVDAYPQMSTKVRPFVCYDVPGDVSSWAPLTQQYRQERLPIDLAWRSGGKMEEWRSGPQYLNDGANIYQGPHASFIAASNAEETVRENRAGISSEGMEAIRLEVARQVHRRIVV
jgi:hypothetical protein